MSFTAKDVMTLREKSGAGMLDCKKALTDADGDMEKAAELLSGVLARHLSELRKLSGTRLREQRYAKFRAFGQFTDAAPEAKQPEEETVHDEAK